MDWTNRQIALLLGIIGAAYLGIVGIVWAIQPKVYIDPKRPALGNVMSSRIPGRCLDVARRYLGEPDRGRVTISVLKYDDMIRELQKCVAKVQATAVPKIAAK